MALMAAQRACGAPFLYISIEWYNHVLSILIPYDLETTGLPYKYATLYLWTILLPLYDAYLH